MKKLKEGDWVYITNCPCNINEMLWMKESGLPYEIGYIVGDWALVWNGNKSKEWWFNVNHLEFAESKDMINKGEKKVNNYKFIFNDPATILFVNGKKYIAKAHDEEFDCEIGVLVCLMKSFGISHLDLKRMIKGAKVQSKGKKTSTNKEEIYVNDEKFEQPELDSKREKLYKEIPQRNTKDYMTKIPFYSDIPTSDIDSGFKVPMAEENVVVSPKGKKRGQPYKFFAGDKVVVRDCSYYKYTTNANAKQLLNRVWEIAQDNSDFAGSLYVINGIEFSGSELEPVKD